MSTITIYATAKHKQKENMGCSAYQIFNKKAKKPTEKVSQFDSESKVFTQLTTLIQSVQSVGSSDGIDEVKLYTDFALIQDFLNGTVIEWESNGWARTSGRPIPHADLWKEFSELCVEYNVHLIATEEADEKMVDLSKAVLNDSRKTKKSTGRKGKQSKANTEVEEVSAPSVMEEIPETVKETPKKSTAKKEKVATKPTKTEVVPVPTSVPEPALKQESVEEKVVATSSETTVKVDADLLKSCEALFGEIGLDVNTAVTMFLKDSLRKQGLTLDLKL